MKKDLESVPVDNKLAIEKQIKSLTTENDLHKSRAVKGNKVLLTKVLGQWPSFIGCENAMELEGGVDRFNGLEIRRNLPSVADMRKDIF